MCPLFEYECSNCKTIEEHLEREQNTHKCVKCQKKMKFVLSSGNFRSTGEGFYKPNKKDDS